MIGWIRNSRNALVKTVAANSGMGGRCGAAPRKMAANYP
jgi:hypothetical protein